MPTKFDCLYHKVICEATDIASEQIVIDAIEDEFIENEIQLKEDWKMHVSPIVSYIEENLPEEETIKTIDYMDLIELIKQALNEFNLMQTEIEEEQESLVIRRFPSKTEFIEYINNKYDAEYVNVILTTIDPNDGIPVYRYYIENKDGGITFSEKLADLGLTLRNKFIS
jgi:hypothetical protein